MLNPIKFENIINQLNNLSFNVISSRQSSNMSLTKPTIFQRLRNHEIGSSRAIDRSTLRILRKLIESDDYRYILAQSYTQRTPFLIAADKIFTQSGRFACGLRMSEISLDILYNLKPNLAGTRFNSDKMICLKMPVSSLTLLPEEHYRPFSLYLTDNNHLLQVDFDKGTIMDDIFLGSMERCKFGSIGWQEFGKTIIIQSNDLRVKTKGKYLSYNILMSVMPIKFIACFALEGAVFENQRQAVICDGMLILNTYQKPPDLMISLYSLKDIICEENFLFRTDLDMNCSYQCDECKYSLNRTIGRDNHGFPINLVIKSKPPELETILAGRPGFTFGGHPFHLIYSPPGSPDTFKIERIEDKVTLINGSIQFTDYQEEFHRVVFHDDFLDPRVLAIESHKIVFYKIINDTLVKDIEVSPTPLEYLQEFQNRQIELDIKDDSLDRSIFAHGYDEETDIFMLIGVDLSDSAMHRPFLCMFDNTTGKQLKKFRLHLLIEESNDYEIHIDRDLLFINEMSSFTPNKLLVYKMKSLLI